MPFETLLVEKDGHVAVVTINRPKVLNALNATVLDELGRAIHELGRDAAIRVVIITGAGDKAFVAGADIGELNQLPSAAAGAEKARAGHVVGRALEKSRLPVIMAINGYALGGGLELAMAGDIRIAADTAKLGQPEVNLGITAGFGGSQRLPRLVGRGMASYMLFTGEHISAQEAKQCNLVEKVVPADQLMVEARRIAGVIASRGPLAVAATKWLMDRGLQVDLDAALALEADEFGEICMTKDAKEGTAAFLEKRTPNFTGT